MTFEERAELKRRVSEVRRSVLADPRVAGTTHRPALVPSWWGAEHLIRGTYPKLLRDHFSESGRVGARG